MFLPVPRLWGEGSGDTVTGAECTHTLTHRCIRPTEIHSQAGDLLRFVALSLYFFLVAQQCLVWTGERKKKKTHAHVHIKAD